MRKMEDAFAQARGLLGASASAKGREMINNALGLVDAWPQEEKPEQLQTLIAEGKRLLEFDTQASLIRRDAEEQNKEEALEKLEKMRHDPRFKDLPELRAFVSEMDRYRDSGDQLREAREARNQGDWKRVYDLTAKLKDSKAAKALGAQVEALYVEAEQEVRIEDARALLDNLEIKKANSIISQILATEKDARRLAMLTDRLAPEKRIIDDSIANTKLVQPAYDHALALRSGREDEQLQALRIFRYLGGISKEKFAEDLPEYILTLRTDDARKAAVDVANALREKCLPPLQTAFKGDKRKKIDPNEFQHLSNFARILREGNLAHSSDEKALVRWVEIEWGRHVARAKQSVMDWDAVVDIWALLNERYPDSEEAIKALDEARQEQSTMQLVLGNLDDPSAKPRDILSFIKDALENPELKHLWALIKEKREQIFQRAQDDLVKTARDALASGTNDDKIRAFVALVDLRELEEIAEIPEARRRSVAALKAMNPNDFKSVVDVVIQQSNAFSVAQGSVEKSIQISEQLVTRLEIFLKISPLFSGRVLDVNERLEKRRNELALLNQKLKEVRAILDEVIKFNLWDDAVSRGAFDVLRVKRDAIAGQGLPASTIPDIKEFDLRLRETEEAYDHIKNQATLVKQAFDLSEDFKQAVTLLRRLATLPQDWQAISQQAYERILAQMDYLFRVSNVYGGGKSLAGRADIETAALRRDEQFDIWKSWEKTCELKLTEAKQKVQIVNGYELGTKSIPTRQQRADWEGVLLSAQSLLETLTNPPERLRENVLSKKAMDIFENSKAKIELADGWKYSAEQALATLDHVLQSQGFPTPEDFNNAVTSNDLPRLQKLIAQAEQAGALSEDEKRRLNTYKITLQRMMQAAQKPKGSWPWNVK
jgi:hypothetical protein